MKWMASVLAALLLAAVLPLSAMAKELDDYYYEDDEIPAYDDSWESYYPDGFVYGGSDVIQIGGGSVTMELGQREDLSKDRTFHRSGEDYDIRIVGSLKWASKDPQVASVDSRGVVTAHQVGSTRITASHTDQYGYKVTQTIRLSIRAGTAVPTGNPDHYFDLTEGRMVSLRELLPAYFTPETTLWASNKEKIATVDANGLVTTWKIGDAAITATFVGSDGQREEVSFSIRVVSSLLDAPDNVIKITIPKGKTLNIGTVVYPNYANFSKMECITGDAQIASADGFEITARQPGSCTVTIIDHSDTNGDRQQKIQVIVANNPIKQP